VVTAAGTTADFLGAAVSNGMGVHGPYPPEEAARVAVECAVAHAAGRRVAVPTKDRLLEALGLRDALAWAGADVLPASDVAWRESIGAAGVGVTGARWGIAATGTLVLTCGEGRPRATHVVPPAHVCLVRARDLVPTIAELVARLEAEPQPSLVHWVSGPSRTADLEMRLTIGVHGPRAVDVVVVG
jgi:L-lactate dehydrogenase complex protein LldG